MNRNRFWEKAAGFSIWLIFLSLFCSASGISIGTALLVLSVAVLFHPDFLNLRRFPLFMPLILLIAALGVSILFAEGEGFRKSFGKLRYLLFYFFIGVYFARYAFTAERMAGFAVYFSFATLVMCVLQFTGTVDLMHLSGLMPPELAPIIGTGGRFFHARGFIYHHNPFAFTSLMLFCLLLGQILTTASKADRTRYLAAAMCLIACIGMSGSRGAWVSLTVCLIFYAVLLGRRFWKAFAPIAAVGLICAGLLAVPLAERFGSIRPSQNNERFRLWEISWDLFREKPVFGHGYHYGFELNRERYMTEEEKLNPHFPTDPHSLYFDLLATTGLVGFGAFLFFIYSTMRSYFSLWRRKRDSRDQAILLAGMGCFVCFLVGTGFDSHFFHSQTLMAVVFFLALGQSPGFKDPIAKSA